MKGLQRPNLLLCPIDNKLLGGSGVDHQKVMNRKTCLNSFNYAPFGLVLSLYNVSTAFSSLCSILCVMLQTVLFSVHLIMLSKYFVVRSVLAYTF